MRHCSAESTLCSRVLEGFENALILRLWGAMSGAISSFLTVLGLLGRIVFPDFL
jgi:hypothetical protein